MIKRIKEFAVTILQRGSDVEIISKKLAYQMKTYPEQIIINPVDKCNLACVFCPTGKKMYKPKKEIMDLQTFRIILRKISFVKTICLFNWGEPFLNSQIFEMIKMAKKQDKYVVIHSNFSLKKDMIFFNKIIDSKLDELSVSCNGASQETYKKYHINGDFKLVFSNIIKLRELQKKCFKSNPKIIWQFLVNRYNEDELQQAENLAKDMGIKLKFDFFRLAEDLPDSHNKFGCFKENKKQWLHKLEKKFVYNAYRKKTLYPLEKSSCPWLFSSLIINTDGTIFPCCYISDPTFGFGNLMNTSFEKIWDSNVYQYSRSLFLHQHYKGPKMYSICEICNNFTKI